MAPALRVGGEAYYDAARPPTQAEDDVEAATPHHPQQRWAKFRSFWTYSSSGSRGSSVGGSANFRSGVLDGEDDGASLRDGGSFPRRDPSLRRRPAHKDHWRVPQTVRLGMTHVPVSYAELSERRAKLSRAIFEPLLYLFFLACFVVMLQLLPTLRSYGERAEIESEIDALFAKGRRSSSSSVAGSTLSNRGYGPLGPGLSTPALCPDTVLWESRNTLVETDRVMSETNAAFTWAMQVARTFHRPTRCEGCSYEDFRLHSKYQLMATWLKMDLADGLPRTPLGDTSLAYGVRFHDSLLFDYSPVRTLLARESLANFSTDFVGGDLRGLWPLYNFDAFDNITASEINWHTSPSYGYSFGASDRVSAHVELACANGIQMACEVHRRRSTSFHNLNDMCSPLDPDVLATSLQALTNDSNCIQATGVFTSSASDDRRASGTTNGECCAEIDMGWRMLLRRTPPNSGSGQWNVTAAEPGAHKGSNNGLSVNGERENGFATDSLWVLAQYDSTEARHSSTGISYVFLPMDLYPGAQGVALAVFQVIFVIFTCFYLCFPIVGRLWAIERSLRYRTPHVMYRFWRTLASAASRKWMVFDTITFAVMITCIALYVVYVDKHNAVTGAQIGLDALEPMGSQSWDDVTLTCCGETVFATGQSLETLYSPMCCASKWGNCHTVCSADELRNLTTRHWVPKNDPGYLRDFYLNSAIFGEEPYFWLGRPWTRSKQSVGGGGSSGQSPPIETGEASPFEPPPSNLSRSCVHAGEGVTRGPPNVTWCGFPNNEGACTCDLQLANTIGGGCEDVDEVCGGEAPPLPEGWYDIDWKAYSDALQLNFQMSPPLGEQLQLQAQQALLTTPEERIAVWESFVQEWYDERLRLPYELYDDAIEAASSAEYNWLIALAFTALLLFLRVLRYAHIDARMSLMLTTLAVAAGTLLFFMASGSLVFFGFCFFAQIYNGYLLLPGYTTFFETLLSVFNLLFDPFPNEYFPSASKWPFYVWYFLYMIVVSIVALNLVIAIIVSSFEIARDFAAARNASGRRAHTIRSAVTEWRALGAALAYTNGAPDLSKVYAFYSGRSPASVDGSAITVQRYWRGHAARVRIREETGQEFGAACQGEDPLTVDEERRHKSLQRLVTHWRGSVQQRRTQRRPLLKILSTDAMPVQREVVWRESLGRPSRARAGQARTISAPLSAEMTAWNDDDEDQVDTRITRTLEEEALTSGRGAANVASALSEIEASLKRLERQQQAMTERQRRLEDAIAGPPDATLF